MSNSSEMALSERKLRSSVHSSMCGRELVPGELYVIAGRTANINLCMFIKEYKQMTIVERRGFAHRYAKGCQCDVSIYSIFFKKNIIIKYIYYIFPIHSDCPNI